MKIDFTDRTVLVTGATRGIGKTLAEEFAERGARTILTGTDREEIDELNRSTPDDRHYHRVDFTEVDSTREFLDALREYDRIDVCVNNAGINRINEIDRVSREDWDDVLAVNLTAPFLVTREMARKMKERGYGRIVNIASIFGVVSRTKRSAYTSSKYGLRGMTITASLDLASHGVLVNAVSPGFVLTDLTREILSEVQMKELEARVPVRRLASPEDIAPAVLFLSSEHNTYITGQNLVVDGGFTNV